MKKRKSKSRTARELGLSEEILRLFPKVSRMGGPVPSRWEHPLASRTTLPKQALSHRLSSLRSR